MRLEPADVEARRAALDWLDGVDLSADGVVTATCPSCSIPGALFLTLPAAADDPLGIHCFAGCPFDALRSAYARPVLEAAWAELERRARLPQPERTTA